MPEGTFHRSVMPGFDPLGQAGRGDVPASARVGYGAAFRVAGRPGDAASPPDRARAHDILRRAVAMGAMLIDTADSYGPALSEELVAGALHPYPPALVIATKGGVERLGPDATRMAGRPEQLRAACEASLRRLRVDTIGLYQLHWPDPGVPLAEQIGALSDLRDAGKIRHIGLCNVSVAELTEARSIAPIAAVQHRLGIANPAGGVLADACARHGLSFIAYGSLAALRDPALAPALAQAARRAGFTAAQLALAWVLDRAPNAIVIPGTLRADHLAENMGARHVPLGWAEIAAMLEPVPA